jgi:ATP-dependent DNA helicase RecQ
MRLVYGIGDTKLRDFGGQFLELLDVHCGARGLPRDNAAGPLKASEPRKNLARPNPQRTLAFDLFDQGAVVEDVMHQTGRGRGTVFDYLADYIRERRPASLHPWVQPDVYQRVVAAARLVGTDRLKPLFLALGEQVPYDQIRLVVTHFLASTAAAAPPGTA